MIKLLGAAALLLAMGAAQPTWADDEVATSLPSGVEPFEQPIALRYQPLDHFVHAWLKTMVIGKGRPTLIEGFEMRGSVKAQADLLLWTYKLYNLGRDGKLRELGEVEVLTDVWGKVEKVSVPPNALPSVPMQPGFYTLLDANHFSFPLCCLPRSPVGMGVPVDLGSLPPDAGQKAAEPGKVVSDDRHSVAVGVLTKDGRHYLVLRNEGAITLNVDGNPSRSEQAGYTLIDTNNGLPYFEIKSSAIEAIPGNKAFTIMMVNRRQSDY